MTNLNHLDAEFDEKSKPIPPFAVSKGTNEYIYLCDSLHKCERILCDSLHKVEKWRKSGYNPPKTGSGGRLTSMLFKGGVELIIKIALPIGCDPGGVLEITFFLEKKMILLHRSPAGRLWRPPTG